MFCRRSAQCAAARLRGCGASHKRWWADDVRCVAFHSRPRRPGAGRARLRCKAHSGLTGTRGANQSLTHLGPRCQKEASRNEKRSNGRGGVGCAPSTFRGARGAIYSWTWADERKRCDLLFDPSRPKVLQRREGDHFVLRRETNVAGMMRARLQC